MRKANRERDSWYARFVVAWPIWAGGYPTIAEVLGLLSRHHMTLRDKLDVCLKSLLGREFELEELGCQADGYVLIAGLSPLTPQENGVEVRVSLGGPSRADIHSVFTNVVGQLEAEIREVR